jgi:trypsin-like peptidase
MTLRSIALVFAAALPVLMPSLPLATTDSYAPPPETGSTLTTEVIVEKILPSMVEVRAKKPSGIISGSGFILRSSGVLVTNLHVVEGASVVSVKVKGGEVFDQVRIVGYDKTRDLALVKFPGFGLPEADLGNSDDVKIGGRVVAVGHPSGLEDTVTQGIVSGIRSLESGIKVIQTDAAASPGNSGGPLVNEAGKVIGVVAFGISEKSLNFAIPINYVRGLMELDTQLSLSDFNAQVGQQTSLFGQHDTGSHQGVTGKWRSLESNTIRALRQDGDYISGEVFTRDESTPLASYDLKKAEDGTYVGRAIGTWTCQYWAAWAWPAGEWRPNSCKTEDQIALTKIEANRIEGRILTHQPIKGPDRTSEWRNYCKTCGDSVEKTWQTFVWVRVE